MRLTLRLLPLLLLPSCFPDLSSHAAFTFAFPAQHNAPARVDFSNESINAVTYQWDFGDGSTAQDQNPTHVYTQSGGYHVILTVYGKCDTTSTIQFVSIE